MENVDRVGWKVRVCFKTFSLLGLHLNIPPESCYVKFSLTGPQISTPRTRLLICKVQGGRVVHSEVAS